MTTSFQRTVSVRQLRVVAVLGAERHFGKAAELLHMTQPAVSRALAEMERAIDTRLFERTTQKVVPTSAGQRLIYHAQKVLEQLDQAQADLSGLSGGARELRVGAIPSFSSALLGEVLASMSAMLPDNRYQVRSGTAAQLYASLLAGSIDAMLCHAELTVDLNKVEVVAVYEEATRTLCAPSHRFARRRRLQWSELATERWILPPQQTPLRAKLDRMLAVHRTESMAGRPMDIEVEQAQTALALLKRGDCLWATAGREALGHVRHEVAALVAQPGPILRGPMCCFIPREGRSDLALRTLLQCLEAVAGPYSPDVADTDLREA